MDAGHGMADAEHVEPGNRRRDCRLAVIDIVGEPDRPDAGWLQRLAGNERVGEKSFMFHGMPALRPVETAFEVAKDDIGAAELFLNEGERYRRIGDVHQVHVTGEDHLHRHLPPMSSFADTMRILYCLTGEGRCPSTELSR